MKITSIKMSPTNKTPFNHTSWRETTFGEKAKVFSTLSKFNSLKK